MRAVVIHKAHDLRVEERQERDVEHGPAHQEGEGRQPHAGDDLRAPPGNRLEALKGTRKGQHSIRINEQWRVCFVWTAEGASDVEIVDYH